MLLRNRDKIFTIEKFYIYNYVLLFLVFYFIIFDYSHFGLGIVVFIIFFGFETIITKPFKVCSQLLVIFFYFKKFFLGYYSDNSFIWKSSFYSSYDPYFPDLILVLRQINCNSLDCVNVGGYGPLLYLIRTEINIDIFIENFLYILFFGICIFILRIFSHLEKYTNLLLIALVSPTLNLLIHQMNIDIFFIIAAVICLQNPSKNTLLKAFVLLIISLLKLHPAFLILGLILLGYLRKDKKIFVINLISLIVFMTIFIWYLFDQNTLLSSPRPSGLQNSIGLLSVSQFLWINFIKITNQYRDVLIIYILLGVFLLIVFIKVKGRYQSNRSHISDIEFIISLWVFLNYLYANYDYRTAILMPIFLITLSTKRNKESRILLLLFILSPINTIYNIYFLNLLILLKTVVFFIIFLELGGNIYAYYRQKTIINNSS